MNIEDVRKLFGTPDDLCVDEVFGYAVAGLPQSHLHEVIRYLAWRVKLHEAELIERMNTNKPHSLSYTASMTTSPDLYPRRSRTTAILLALFLGGIGIHKFYLRRPIQGVLFLLFSWTFMPAIIALVDVLLLCFMSQVTFDRKYNGQ